MDLACGDGSLLQILAQRFPDTELTGIDMSPEELSLARGRLGDRAVLRLANAHALPFADAAFDAVTCHMALMLMDDVDAAIAEVARVLRHGGTFAAVIDGGRATDPILISFIHALREIERDENLPPLNIGDSRLYDADAVYQQLSCYFSTYEIEPDQLDLTAPGQVRASLLTMYNVARLSRHGRSALERHLDNEIAKHIDANGAARCTFPLRHLTATRL